VNDRDQLLVSLDAGRGELLAAIEGMTDEQAAVKPEGGGWSVLDCLEHVAIVETLSLRRLTTQSVELPQEASREREPVLYARIATRNGKVEAPELVQPKGRYTTISDAVGAFLDARARTLKWLENCDFDLRRRSVEHPALGAVSAFEFVIIMAAHTARHARQIQEVRGRN
jgi:hypothetical protein